jgi:hypothetical protein
MSEQENLNKLQDESMTQTAPYEPVLLIAFDKLTNQILIFLLAYVILLIGLGVFAIELSDTLKNLLYIIPILGAGGYFLSQNRKISNDAEKHGINVKAGWVSGKAKVIGKRSPTGEASVSENIDVIAGVAKGEAEIAGVVIEDKKPVEPPPDIGYLSNLYEDLNDDGRRKLIEKAHDYVEKHKKVG